MISAPAALRCLLSIPLLLAPAALRAQAVPTAAERLQISAFGGISGVYTGLDSGRNLSITAGADLRFRRYFGLNPSFEIRGTYPVDDGKVDAQRNILGGLRLAATFNHLHPYADFLFGRGEIKYNPPLLDAQGTFLYTQNATNVLSPGAGIDLDLSPHFSLRGDFQLQRYASPVVSSSNIAQPIPVVAGVASTTSSQTAEGHLDAKSITAAIVYRFDFNRHAIGGRRSH